MQKAILLTVFAILIPTAGMANDLVPTGSAGGGSRQVVRWTEAPTRNAQDREKRRISLRRFGLRRLAEVTLQRFYRGLLPERILALDPTKARTAKQIAAKVELVKKRFRKVIPLLHANVVMHDFGGKLKPRDEALFNEAFRIVVLAKKGLTEGRDKQREFSEEQAKAVRVYQENRRAEERQAEAEAWRAAAKAAEEARAAAEKAAKEEAARQAYEAGRAYVEGRIAAAEQISEALGAFARKYKPSSWSRGKVPKNLDLRALVDLRKRFNRAVGGILRTDGGRDRKWHTFATEADIKPIKALEKKLKETEAAAGESVIDPLRLEAYKLRCAIQFREISVPKQFVGKDPSELLAAIKKRIPKGALSLGNPGRWLAEELRTINGYRVY